MSTLTDYKRMNVVTPDPTGSGGLAINNIFKALADRFGNLQTSDPGAGNDNTQGYAVGSRWFNTSTNIEWLCTNDATSAAVWKAVSSQWTTGSSTIYYSGGSVGIGTSSPARPLDVVDNQNGSSYLGITNTTDGTAASSGLFITQSGATNRNGTVVVYSPSVTGTYAHFANTFLVEASANIASGLALSAVNGSAGRISFYTGGRASTNERMRIDINGNVGIGTTTPGAALDVTGDASARTVIAKPQSSAPSSPTAGQIYYDSTANHFYGWNGSAWKQLDN